MTPQQLMDLPNYGQAERELRLSGQWDLTPAEKIEKMIGELDEAIDMMSNVSAELEKQWRLME